MEALRGSMVAASEQPQGYAVGGPVSALPTLQDLANPNFDYSSMGTLNTGSTFTPMTQNVPMSVVQGPAFGSMGTDVYDWKAPTAQAAPQPYSTANMEAAQTYNRRVPTAAATVNVPMPGYETPTPNVPQMPVQEMAPAQPMAPPPAPVAQPAISPEFTPVPSPLGPDPFEVRRQGAAAELEALRAREEQERMAREAEAKRISDLELAERQRQEQLNLISLENARVRDLRLAEEKRLADEKAAQVVSAPASVVEEQPKPKELTLDMYRDQFGTEYGTQYYMNLKNAQRLIREGRREDISGPQMEQARFLSEQMDKGIYGPPGEVSEEYNSWYAGDSGD
jgi:hypothetical protein